MDGQSLIVELNTKIALLDSALRQFGKRGQTYAQAERDYRVALAQKIMEERAEGTPVTIISDICRGDKDIALKKMERDIAETTYDAAKEAVNVYKLQIRVLEAQIQREWGASNS